jgi:uncharacterized protein (DUF58 family)
MTEAFICDAIRTPIGRYGGTLSSIRTDDLGALPLKALMARHPKRALVVVLTNFRDEDCAELEPALRLLGSRHLVLLASLRERVLRELSELPLSHEGMAVDVAGAHLFAQSRDDAFRRLATRNGLVLDVEPQHLAAELVNRYRAVKRAGLL